MSDHRGLFDEMVPKGDRRETVKREPRQPRKGVVAPKAITRPRSKSDGRERTVRQPSAYELERAGLPADQADELVRAWLARDLRTAQQWISKAEARNRCIRLHSEIAHAQSDFLAVGGDLDELELNVEIGEPGIPETPIPLTAQQMLLARAHTYATNEQLAAFLGRRVTTDNIRVALHRLSKLDDTVFIGLPVFVKPGFLRR